MSRRIRTPPRGGASSRQRLQQASPASVRSEASAHAATAAPTNVRAKIDSWGFTSLPRALHAGTVRQTAKPRHSIHLYYGLADEPPLSDRLTAIPTRLSQSADPELRRLFSKKNEITKLFEDNFT